jgi:hypothetical protein
LQDRSALSGHIRDTQIQRQLRGHYRALRIDVFQRNPLQTLQVQKVCKKAQKIVGH